MPTRENDQVPADLPPDEFSAQAVDLDACDDEPLNLRAVGGQLKIFLLRAVALLGAFALFAVIGTGAAGWYTSRSQFCSSCHIMEPYYQSWQESSHRDVSCIKCHFAPGAAEKARGKLLGLVQLVKYVTSTQGPRPVAEVPDASCLRSGCHDTRVLAGRVDFKGIPFDHAPHLGQLRRDKKLHCTSCHSQIVQGTHMTVTATTCFLCHFKDGHFNEGLGACTRCHAIPDTSYELGGGVTFSHDLAYQQGVDCATCHADLIRGNGEVPVERCTVCHNRQGDLERINDEVFMHHTHVTEHNVDCIACHLEIHHSLDTNKVAHAAAQCSSCHPDQHHEQVAMLEGSGGRSIAPQRSNMAAARLSCFSCHRIKDLSSTGSVLMKASMATCIGCHEPLEVASLREYHEQLREVLAQLEVEIERIQTAFEAANLDAMERSTLSTRLKDAGHDVSFLHKGNDIHNSHYASALTASVLSELTSLCRELSIDPPEAKMPEKPARSVEPEDAASEPVETGVPAASEQPAAAAENPAKE